MKQKIEIYGICYNEEKMLPYFIRHYSKLGDIILYDNYSTDKTDEIAKAAGIKVIKFDTGDKFRDDIHMYIKNNCWKKSSADWVIVCDVDEFIYHPKLTKILEHTTDTIFKPIGYDMFSKNFPTTNGQIYEEITNGVESDGYSKFCLFNPKKIKEINFSPGAHISNPTGIVKINTTSGIKLLHMKQLSIEHVIDRYTFFKSRLSEQNIKNRWGVQYNFPIETVTNSFNENLKKSTDVVNKTKTMDNQNKSKSINIRIKLSHIIVLGIVLFITFVALKIAGYITWSWWAITFPIWILVLFTGVMFGIGYLAMKAVKKLKKYTEITKQQ